jgi:hypothetical protein
MLPSIAGFNSSTFTANTAGTQLCYVSAAAASAAAGKPGQGLLAGVVANDTGALVVTVYDGTSTAGPKLFDITLPAGGGLFPIPLYIQGLTGLFLVISAATAAKVTVLWR